MSQEMLAEVDERDEVIGTRPRGEIHRLGLRHRSCHILVFNSRAELYLQKRVVTKDVNPGCWDSSAAGHVDAGESYDTCASRELEEELGIAAATGDLRGLFKLNACADTGWEFIGVYRIDWDGPLRPDPREISEGRWFDTARIDAWVAGGTTDLTESFRLIWRHYRALGVSA